MTKNKLKEYQYKATCKCIEYLSSESTQNALVHLPTGTGKTGVMATLCALTDKNILIVVPNATLPMQVKNEIKTNFWECCFQKSIFLEKIKTFCCFMSICVLSALMKMARLFGSKFSSGDSKKIKSPSFKSAHNKEVILLI